MKKILFFCFVFLNLTGCKKTNVLSFETKVFKTVDTLNCNNQACSEIEIKSLLVNGNDSVGQKINKKLIALTSQLLISDAEKLNPENYREILDLFIEEHKETYKEYAEDAVRWQASVSFEKSFINNRFLNIVIDYYTFLGGAHGYYGKMSVFFDLKTGEQINLKDWLVNMKGFEKIAEHEFRKQNNIPEKASLTDFNFLESSFILPENIIVTNQDIHLLYNPYEIASYAQGIISVKIPIKEVQSYLNPIYFN